MTECRGILSILSAQLSAAPEPEIALLLRYKLAAEVELPMSLKHFHGKNEVELQRQLCAFLIEHGTYAVGTKFGRSETDLVTSSATSPLIIEVKLFKARPNERVIRRARGQLQQYMDQAEFKGRGALVMFNISDTPIHAGREFIDRVAYIAVNLSTKTPSKLDDSIQVRKREGTGDSLEVLHIRAKVAARKKGAS